MCGIVGYTNPDPTLGDISILRHVMLESQIRGKHASGIAWADNGEIKSLVCPVPIGELLQSFNLTTIAMNGIYLITHTRYSTSDISFNQPLIGTSGALVHNGVITQEPKDHWDYPYSTETSNDSELLLRAIENGENPFISFPGASIAALYLSKNGNLTAMRNGLRPLWAGRIGRGTVYASTHHILDVSGVEDIEKVAPVDAERIWRRL